MIDGGAHVMIRFVRDVRPIPVCMQFVEQHGTEDILKHPKVVSKMAKPVRRTKEMLSANVDAPFIVEELFNGIDFISSITRQEFEEIGGLHLSSTCLTLAGPAAFT